MSNGGAWPMPPGGDLKLPGCLNAARLDLRDTMVENAPEGRLRPLERTASIDLLKVSA